MAGDWIKMTIHLDTDPSVIAMAGVLGTDELHVVGRLWKVWSWADQHSLDGNAVRVTCSFLDRITNCPGFAAAMRDVGWLEGRDGALTFPRFDRHNGQTAKTRALGKNRSQNKRNANTVTTVTPEPLPEKRREEVIPSHPKPAGQPTSLDEVIAYGRGPHCGLDAESCRAFWDHYQSTGWKIQGIPMEDWQARLRDWKRKNASKGPHGHNPNRQVPDQRSNKAAALDREGIASPTIRPS
jgi:hypothetical protein